MPAKSVAQREAMAIAEEIKKGKMKAKPGTPSAEMAKSMTHAQLHDFAATKEAGLPQHVKVVHSHVTKERIK